MELKQIRRALLMSNGLLPPMYKRCDYLQTTGYNARIDTGVPGNDSTLVLDCDFVIAERINYGAIFGNHINDSYRCWRLIMGGNPGSAPPRSTLATMYNRKAGSSPTVYLAPSGEGYIGERVNIKMSYGTITATSGSYSYTATTTTDTSDPASTRNLCIGSGSPTQSGSNAMSVRFIIFKIWSQGTLIRNYTPCVRVSDNKAGFYDLVNKTFNPSIGSVDFIAGNN